MKTLAGNGRGKNPPAKKRYSINSGAAIKTKNERGVQKEKFDRNYFSEDDLDRMQALI